MKRCLDFRPIKDLDPPLWCGPQYPCEAGLFRKRILILGESTHAPPEVDTSRYNVLMAEDHINGYRDRFRTKLIRAFLNLDTETPEQIAAFWNSVAYLNFVIPALAKSRIPPTEQMWEHEHQPIPHIIG